MLGEMAAHGNQRTAHIGAVRAAVSGAVDRLLPLLDDADIEVRDGIAFVLSQCPKRKRDALPRLRARYAAETGVQVKARVLAAIQWLDPKTPLVAEALGEDRPLPVRAAAALILARSDQPWTAAAADAVRAAWADGEPLDRSWWWGWQSSPLQDLTVGVGAAVLPMLLESSSVAVREQAVAAAVPLVRSDRAARPAVVPALARALTDESAQVRHDAAWALTEAGAAARPAADALAAAAPGLPPALAALVRLGDERWPALMAARLRAGVEVTDALEVLYDAQVPFDPALLDAITTTDPQDWHRWGIYLVAAWGPQAAAAVPQLTTLLDANVKAWALDGLQAIGPAAAAVLPRLREQVQGRPEVVEEYGRLRVSCLEQRIAIRRIGDDPQPALDGLRAALAAVPRRGKGGFFNVPYEDAARLLDEVGEHGRVLLPEVRALAAEYQDLIGLGWALWRWTGDPAEVRPTLEMSLDLAGKDHRRRTPLYPGGPAIALAEDFGDRSLAPLLVPFLADATSRTRVPAARAIWRLTGDADGLIAPLLKEVTGRPPGFRWAEAFELLTEMGPAAAEAHSELRAVIEHPHSPFVLDFDAGRNDAIGHRDDRFLSAARKALAATAPEQ
jgi:hypothetical protein